MKRWPNEGRVTSTSAEVEGNDRRMAWLYVIGGAIGLLAAAVLLLEKVALLEDPTYVPSCSINPILSCGSIMQASQAEAFGFPNPLIGVAAFPVVITTGVALLAGATFRRWYWRGLLAGTIAGLAFVHWLIFQSLYRIEALCPYCMVVWLATFTLAWYLTLANFSSGRIKVPAPLRPVLAFATKYHAVLLTGAVLIVVALITEAFWDYWSTLP